MWGKRSTSILTSSKLVGQNLWLYNTTDGTTEMVAAAYFLDAFYLGMREGDVIMGAICTGTSQTFYAGVVGPVTTAGGGMASTNAFVSSTA
jgi:fructosamine-3-kinase